MAAGITNVTEDGHVFSGEEELIPSISKQGYFMHIIYDLDENGQRIKLYKEKSAFGYIYKTRSLGLHRIMWAWFNNEVPSGMVVDHISNKHSELKDYELSNLQLLTPSENLAKEKPNWHVSELKCNLSKPRSFYEGRLAGYEAAYEQAKKDKDAKAAHTLRTSIAQTRARLRYYDSHIEEAIAIREAKVTEEAHKREYHERAQKKRDLKAAVDSARKFYLETLAAYGKDDEYVKKLWAEWKLAIAMYHGFCAENKSVS